MMRGTIAIVGRPNVGKSTLFNKLTRSQTSIVADCPGVTRDRIYGSAFYDQEKKSGFTVIDTGGFETKEFNFQPFDGNIVWKQTEAAIKECDLVLFLLDGKHGLHQHDALIQQALRQFGKEALFVVNKIDGEEKESLTLEFYKLNVDSLFPISAAHNKGIKALLAEIKKRLEKNGEISKQASFEEGEKIALIGRPNAGKSSILNRLIGDERSLVSPLAGTTRDSLDSTFRYHGKPYILIDTAGIRRKTKISEALEVQSVMRSLRAIERADLVVLVIDALEGVTDQDARLINLSLDRHKPIAVVVNKWDLVGDKDSKTAQQYEANIKNSILRDAAYIPFFFVSCTNNIRVHKLLSNFDAILEQSRKKVPTAYINEVLQKAVTRHTPHLIRNYSKRIKFYYGTQIASNPPTLVLMCNVAQDIQESYKRYLIHFFRTELEMPDVPIRLILRGKKEVKSRKEAKQATQASASS